MTEFEMVHMSRIRRMSCVMTGRRPVEVHHCGTVAGGGRCHLLTVPLHQDREGGVHRRKDGGGISYTDVEECKMLLECWRQMSDLYGPEYIEEVKGLLRDDLVLQKRMATGAGNALGEILK